MNFNKMYKEVITLPNKDTNKKWYLAPLIPSILWVMFSIVSIFTVNFSLLPDPFVIISILSRILIPIYSILFIHKFYIVGKIKPINYNHMLNFIGYSIAITYVSYILPGVVLDYYHRESSSLLTVFVILSTICPIALYLLLKSPKVKLESSFFTVKEVELEKKMKKDKKLKKQNQKKLRKERNFIQNIWFEILDPLMWAILWVLIINNTIFQLYEIPSSSMVPEFLEKDRVVASKFFSGPHLPLTRYQLPEIIKPKTGDIVTFNNPEVDEPNSNLKYKNVFTRIFQPFFFMLTFSKVDIDADSNGNPKARQLVKRVIAVPGEKLSMVNDKIYKKREGGEWTLMSDIPGEKEWGRNDLFSLDNKNSGAQYMNPQLRQELDNAAEMVFNSTPEMLQANLIKEKELFLNNMDNTDLLSFRKNLMTYNRNSIKRVSEIIENIETSYGQMMQVNRSNIPTSSKNSIVKSFNDSLDRYYLFTVFEKINDLGDIIQMDRDFIVSKFTTDVVINKKASPYDTFVIKLDALTKLKSLEFYNSILSSNEFNINKDLAQEIKLLIVYTKGLQFKNFSKPFSFFGAGNFPEYPIEADKYIPKGEYFLLGDNRYNSLDSRMGNTTYDLPLVPENNDFSEDISVSWKPHTITDAYIHGEVALILFPFSHFKLF